MSEPHLSNAYVREAHFIDAHCHLSEESSFPKAAEWIQEAQLAQVRSLQLGGVEPSEWARQKQLKDQFPDQIRTSFGVHPWWVEKVSRAELERFLDLLKAEAQTADAIGETGLDFYEKRDPARFLDQEFAFRAQINIAVALQKPLVLHVVHAHVRALQILREETQHKRVPLQVHRFSGSLETALEWVKEGALLSFTGGLMRDGVSARGSESAKRALKGIPLENLLFETDGLVPPQRVIETYQWAAELRSMDLEALQEKVAENFARLR